jgi:hypothetical protein
MNKGKVVLHKIKFRCDGGVFGGGGGNDSLNDLAGFCLDFMVDPSPASHDPVNEGVKANFGKLVSGELPEQLGGIFSYTNGAGMGYSLAPKFVPKILDGTNSKWGWKFDPQPFDSGNVTDDSTNSGNGFTHNDVLNTQYPGGQKFGTVGSFDAIATGSFAKIAPVLEAHDGGDSAKGKMFIGYVLANLGTQHAVKSMTKPTGARRRRMSGFCVR